MPLAPGDIFEETYEILNVLGEGGMGIVYMARQIASGRMLAIKVLQEFLIRDNEQVKRFQREAKAIAKLQHKHIVVFYHLGFTSQRIPYAAMEYLPGKSLNKILNTEDALEPQLCAHIMKQVCQALAVAHEAGIMHRDIKPANIIVLDTPEPNFVKVVDFGLAKMTPASGLSTEKLTETGLLIGSLHYMSPEQARGMTVDERSDVYACGCVMYETLTGQKPFDADNFMGVIHKQCNEEPPRFSATVHGGTCPAEFEQVCRKAMEKSPEERYQSMDDFIADLDVLISGKGALSASTVPDEDEPAGDKLTNKKPRVKPRRSKLAPATAAVLLLCTCVAAAVILHNVPQERIAVEVMSAARGPVSCFIERPEAQQGEKIQGWKLIQDNPHTGEWVVYLSANGMAALNRKMGCCMVTASPDWNVVMYNDRTHVYFESPLAEWKGAKSSLKSGKQAHAGSAKPLVENPPKKLKEETVLGMKTTLYLTDNLVTTGLKKVEFCITPEIESPEQLRQVFGKIYGIGLTKLKGLPLAVSYIDENGKRSPVFITTKIERQAIPTAYFTFPKNYKRVDSEIAVLMDEKGRETMASIMDDLGEGSEGEDLDVLLDEKVANKSKAARQREDDALELDN